MKSIRSLVTLLVMLLLACGMQAAVPPTINYQGRLTDAAGTPLTGNKTMSIKVYDAATGGTQLYSEILGNVSVDSNGIYGFQFGANGNGISSAISATFGSVNEHWLELTVDGVAQQPRHKLQAVPFALMAKGLENGSVSSAMIADGAIGLSKITGLGTAATANSTDFAASLNATLAGVPTAPTAAPGTDSTQVATTAFVLANGTNLTNVVFAKSHGVKADGVSDDTLALQAAIDAASASATASSRATVVLPRGVIRIAKTTAPNPASGDWKHAILLKSNVNLVGQGMGATVLKLLDSVVPDTPVLLGKEGATNIKLSCFTVDGNAIVRLGSVAGGEDEGINFKGGSNIIITHVEVKNTGQDGIDLDAGSDIIVQNCVITSCYGSGIHAIGGGPIRVSVLGCRITDNGFVRYTSDETGAGVDSSSYSMVISNCVFKDNNRELYVYGGQCLLASSSFTHAVGSLDAIIAGSTTDSRLYVDSVFGSMLNSGSDIAFVKVLNGHPYVSVRNCRVNGGDGVSVVSGGRVIVTTSSFACRYAVWLQSTTFPAQITANYFEPGYTSGIRIGNSSSGMVSGNVFTESSAGCSHVQINSGCTGWSIIDNLFPATGYGIVSNGNGGAETRVIDNTGGLSLSLGAAGGLVKGNQLGAVTLLNSSATGIVFEDNVISGSISHIGSNYASNTWRRNTGAGCAGVFYGTATLASGSVVISTSAANSSRRFSFNRQSTNGSTGIGQLALGNLVPQTSFVINSLSSSAALQSGDRSTVFWEILE